MMSNKRSLSLQKLSVPRLGKPISPKRNQARLQFPVVGDSSIFSGVGKKHLMYSNESEIDKFNIIYSGVGLRVPERTRKMTMPESHQSVLQQNTMSPVKRQNPEDSLTMMEQKYNSRQLLIEQPNRHESLRQPIIIQKPKPKIREIEMEPRLENTLLKRSFQSNQRVNSLPQLSPLNLASTPNNFAISGTRRINPTYLSSALQANNMPIFMI